MKVDLVLRGGTLVDGTGAPARRADVVIHAGRVLGTGRYDGRADRVLDVSGLIVAPGFVDVHTHYDAQVTWDGLCSPSPEHGVTSVVLGNCGFALAPCRAEARERLLRMLEHVEGMPYASLARGVSWQWESVPEYVAMLARTPLGPNVGTLVGHSSVRAYVLGEDAYERAASDDEIARMSEIVRAAMQAGALGLATSLSPGHVGEGGRPVPSRQASRHELRALAAAMVSVRTGRVLEITPATFPIEPEELGFLQDLSRETGCVVSFSAVLDLPEKPDAWRPIFAQLRAGAARGARVVPQVSCRPMRFDFDLETGCASLDAAPSWRRVRACATRADRIALLGEHAFRSSFRAETIDRPASPSSRRWRSVVLAEARRDEHQRHVGKTLGEIAAARGGDVVDALFDLACAESLEARFTMVLLNDDEERVGELLRQREGLIALSDAGAHVSVLCDAGYATDLLGRWVRGRGLLTWEEAVWRLTGMPAQIYGLGDRGRLAPGAAADVTCFDPLRVEMQPPVRVRDFPAGADRLVAHATGIEHVLVGGRELVRAGRYTEERPGAVLRPHSSPPG